MRFGDTRLRGQENSKSSIIFEDDEMDAIDSA
jgi:hypothetical protein